MKTFGEIFQVYKQNIKFIDPQGFLHWWDLHWLDRAEFDNDRIKDGFICYRVQDNKDYSSKVAFCLNYISAAMFTITDLDIGESLLCEFFKVKDLKDYVEEEYEQLIEALENIGIKHIYNNEKNIICFYTI